MRWKMIVASLVNVAAGLLHVVSAHAGGVSVGINVGVPGPPPPPPVVVAPPQIVIVPGSPVYYAPGVDFNLFVYGGGYYRFHEGAWFIATSPGGPWTYVVRERVPRPVLAVPATYYKIPPGHAKKFGGPGFDNHGRGKRGAHD